LKARARSRLLAVACAETLRPFFVRWAADSARGVYERIVNSLWTARGTPNTNGSTFLAEIEQLPESHFDDSHHRDFFIMLGLGVLYHAVEVVQSADVEMSMRELKSLFSHLADELDVATLPSDLEDAVLRVRSVDEEEAALVIRRTAVQMASKIDAALEPVARDYGWPPDRQRRPPDAI
jgi:hypothetical protein